MRTWKNGNELREIAQLHSKYIYVRTMENGCSCDTMRKATKKQQEIMYGILYGALLALNDGEECRASSKMENAIVNAAEYQADILLRPYLREGEELQGYMCVYLTLKRIIERWEKK